MSLSISLILAMEITSYFDMEKPRLWKFIARDMQLYSV